MLTFSDFLKFICSPFTQKKSIMFSRKQRIREAVYIFTRYPEPGKCKTRLVPMLGEKGAARVQMLMTEHILGQVLELKNAKPDLHVVVYFSGTNEKTMHYWIDRKYANHKLLLKPQRGDDLGEKLMNACLDSFHSGVERLIIVGCDIPGINHGILEDAFSMLKWDDCDLVIGPAEDGGYYLLGTNRRIGVNTIESLFKGIEWGTSKVFEQQVEAAEFLGMKAAKLDQTLRDVDTPEDIGVFEQELGVRTKEVTSPMWSIIIPCLNEVDEIENCLQSAILSCSEPSKVELIICDGGSDDGSVEKVKEVLTDRGVLWKLIHSPAGRGRQMVAGASESSGDNLLFLHVDSRLPQNFDQHAEDCLWIPGIVAGAFRFQLDFEPGKVDPETGKTSKLSKFQARLLEWGANIRSKYGELPYGDQAIFLRKKIYLQVGGMPGYPLFEDFALIEKLKSLGHIGIVEGEPCLTSARRWEKHGYYKVTGMNSMMVAAYMCGVSPDRLASWYQAGRKEKKPGTSESAENSSTHDDMSDLTTPASDGADRVEPVETPPY
ncbi:uncharacterized protein LOC135490645 isoform X2 [Lineus longissimus]|uniref:uncharacterized protein LOC135490645 isoform X2 n=1 Tax=Lineus longissimus TaxID=88925 RepID=UPI00315D9C82